MIKGDHMNKSAYIILHEAQIAVEREVANSSLRAELINTLRHAKLYVAPRFVAIPKPMCTPKSNCS